MRQIVGDVPLGGSPFPPIADYAFLSDCETTRARRARAATSSGCACRAWTARRSSARCSTATPAASGSAPADTTVPAGRRYLPGHDDPRDDLGHADRLGHRPRRAARSGPWHHERRALAHAPPLAHRLRRRPRPAAHAALRQRLGRDAAWTASPSSTTGASAPTWEYDGRRLPPGASATRRGLRPRAAPDDRPAPRLRGLARPRAHDDARRRHRVRRAVVVRARRRPQTYDEAYQPARLHRRLLARVARARRVPRPPVAHATCSAAR